MENVQKPSNPECYTPSPEPFRAGVLNLFCAMDPFGSLVKPMDPFSEYFLNADNIIHKITKEKIILKYSYQYVKKTKTNL
jgi:hypothetical protein